MRAVLGKHYYSKTPITKLSPAIIIQISNCSCVGMETMWRYREAERSFRMYQQNFTSLIGFLTEGIRGELIFFIMLFDFRPFALSHECQVLTSTQEACYESSDTIQPLLKCQFATSNNPFDLCVWTSLTHSSAACTTHQSMTGSPKDSPQNFYITCV